MNPAERAQASAEFRALAAGGRVDWADLNMTAPEFLESCAAHELLGLMHRRVLQFLGSREWPDEIFQVLARNARAETALELVRCAEITRAIDALGANDVHPVVVKGTALAYTVYDAPIERPRLDTDLLVGEPQVAAARAALADCGYVTQPYCDELFSQFQMTRTDEFGIPHVIDVHWKISTQPVFADVLSYDEVIRRAVPVPALGNGAAAASLADALLLACIHPVMHHQNAERLLWTYDIHLLASRMGPDELQQFARRAAVRRVARVCGHELRRARTMFGTSVAPTTLDELSAASHEPSAEYLASQRKWRHELASSIRGTASFGDRVKLLRYVLLPSPSYMLGSYGLSGKSLAPLLLPALYVHRNLRGAWKVLTGKK